LKKAQVRIQSTDKFRLATGPFSNTMGQVPADDSKGGHLRDTIVGEASRSAEWFERRASHILGRVAGIDEVFDRIVANEGRTFRQVRGETFTYSVAGQSIKLSRTNRTVSKGEFAKALQKCPLTGPGQITDVQAPSYVFAILTDDRISGCE
jgi:hypothetical protein